MTERTRERVPLDWAMTQNNLGNALQTLGERESGTETLQRAVAAYEAALTELPRERTPLEWARTQNNLGSLFLTVGVRTNSKADIERGKLAVQSAWDALKASGHTQYDEYFAQQLAGFEAALTNLK